MSMRTIARSSSNRNSASALASSVLPTPVGPRNRNDPVGRSGSATPDAGPPDGVGDCAHRIRLADDALAEPVLHPQQLLGLALEQPTGGDAGPGRTTSAMSSGPTSSLSIESPSCTESSADVRERSSSGSRP